MKHDFSDMYTLYKDPIFHYCCRKCRDNEIGEDLMQETFLRFFVCLKEDANILLPRAFLYRIAHNLFINHVRKKKEASLDQLAETGFEPAVDPWHHTHSHLDAERPMKMLSSMQKPYQEVLHNHFFLGLPAAAIAKKLGTSSNTVSVRLFRGVKHLRRLLKDKPLAAAQYTNI